MAGFDADKYFLNRMNVGVDKLQALETARAEKLQALQQYAGELNQRNVERNKSLNESVVGMLGLNPDGVAGTVANEAVRLGAAFSKTSGMVGSGIWDLIGAASNINVPDDVKQARKNQLDGKATQEDLDLLARPVGTLTKDYKPKPGHITNGERVAQMEEAFKNSQDIREFFDLSNRVYQGDTQRLHNEITDSSPGATDKVRKGVQQLKDGEDWDGLGNLASGIKESVGNAIKAGANNPKAVVESLIDQAPNLLSAAAGNVPGTAYNLLYGLDTFGEGVQAKIKKAGGAMPSDTELAKTAGWAAASAAAEIAGDKLMDITGVLKGAGKAATASEEAVAEVARKTLKDPLLGAPGAVLDSAVGKVAKATAKGGVGEYLTEGAQTATEAAAKGDDTTLEKVNLGASLGLLTGAPMSGGVHALQEVGTAAEKAVVSAAKAAQKLQGKMEARKNPDALLDPKAPTYDPTEGAIALHQQSSAADATPEVKEANVQKLDATVSDLKVKRDTAFAQTQAGVDAAKEQIASLQEESKNATPELAPLYAELIAEHQKTVDAFGTLDEATKAKATEDVATLDKQVAKVSKLHSDLLHKNDRALDLEAEVTQANTAVDQADDTTKAKAAQSASRVINLSMRDPERVTPAMAKALAQNKANGLDDSQREYLTHHAAYQEAVAERKSMPQVRMEILNGDPSKNQLGLKQYRERVETAIREGNQEAADRAIGMLNKFTAHHAQKLALFAKTFDQVKGTNNTVLMVPTKGAGWGVSPNQSMSAKELSQAQGNKIHGGSKILIDMIAAELKAMRASSSALTVAKDMHFNLTAPVVQSTSVLPEVTSVKPSAPSKTTVDSQQSNSVTQSTTSSNQSNVDSIVDSKTESTKAPEPAPIKVAKNPRHPRERDDLVGAILRVTGDQGISTKLLHDTIQEDLKHAGRAKKAFSKDGQEDLGELAQRLFEEEGYGDGTVEKLQDLLNEQIERNVRSNEKEVELRAKAQHKANVSEANRQAAEAGVKGVRGRRTIAHVEADIAAKEAELNALEWEQESDAKEYVAALDAAIAAGEVTPEEAIEYLKQGVTENEESSQAQHDESPVAAQEAQGESTAESTRSDEGNAEAQAGESSNAGGTNEGQLTALSGERSPKGTLLKVRSKAGTMVADFFTQAAKSKKHLTVRPLVAVKDFLSHLTQDLTGFVQYVTTPKDQITDQQKAAIYAFTQKAKEWSKDIQAHLVRAGEKDAAYLYKDMSQFFLIENAEGALDFEENLKTAISYAAFSWLDEQAHRPQGNDDEQINKLLNRSEHRVVTYAERDELSDVDTRKNTAVNALGRRIVQALGIKALPDAPGDAMANLEAQLGAHAYHLLESKKAIVVKEVNLPLEKSEAEIQDQDLSMTQAALAAKARKIEKAAKVEHEFISIPRDENGKPTGLAAEVSLALSGSKGILDELFAPGNGLSWPTLAPVKFSQTHTASGQLVPSELAKTLQNDNNQENRLREDLWNLWGSLSDDAIIEMAGGVRYVEGVHHVSLEKGMTAKWNALQRELDNLREFAENHLLKEGGDYSTPFFFDHDIWQQQRVGIKNNGVNPQMNKIQRVAIFRNSWVTQVNMANRKEMNNFRLRVMEGLGENTGKKYNKDSLRAFNRLFYPEVKGLTEKEQQKAAVIRAAIDALVRNVEGESLTAAEQKAIQAGVAAGGEDIHSLDALMAMAHYRIALKKKEKSFTSRLAGEIDGVTNGPILAQWLLGAARTMESLKAALNRGGIFFKGDGFTQYNHWRSQKGNFDLYENMTAASVDVLNQTNNGDPRFAALHALIGDIGSRETGITSAGRNLSKAPVRPMVFGSTTRRAVESMGEDFTQNILKSFEKLVHEPESKQREVLQHLNTLLGEELALPLTVKGKALLKLELSDDQRKAINDSFSETFGQAFKVALDEQLGAFTATRDSMIKHSELMSRMYSATYEAVKDAYIQRLAARGEMELGNSGKPLHELTAKQQKTLERLVSRIKPMVHTPMSLMSGNREEGIPMFKSERQLSQQRKNKGEVLVKDEYGQTIKVNVHSMEQFLTNIGVSAMPFLAHASDSAMSHTANEEGHNLNAHDAHIMGLANFVEAGYNLNKAAWDVALKYSPAQEMFEAMSSSVLGIAQMLQDKTVPETIKARLAESIVDMARRNEVDAESMVSDMVERLHDMAYQADVTRLTAMLDAVAVDQYSSEGSAYLVSEADRKAVQERLDGLKHEMDPVLKTKLQVVSNMLAPFIKRNEDQRQEDSEANKKRGTVRRLSPIQVRQLIEAALNKNSLSASLADLATQISNVIRTTGKSLAEVGNIKGFTAAQVDELIGQLANLKDMIPKDTWGKLSYNPTVKHSNAYLLEQFERRGGMTSVQLVKALNGIFEADPEANQFQLALLNRITPLLGKDLKIRYVTTALDPSLVNAKPITGAKGWYTVASNGKEEIYVLGKEYANSAVNEELMLHELVHAAVAKVVAQELDNKKANPAYTSEALKVVERLQSLQAEAKKHFEGKPAILTQYNDAFQDVQEFITWGMTNKGFQENVLKKFSVARPGVALRFVSAAREFFENVTALFFGRKSSEGTTEVLAMEAFLETTAGLFEAAAATEITGVSDINQAQRSQSYTTNELFDALGANQNPGFQEHLRGLLMGIVNRLQGPHGAFTEARMAMAQAPLDIWTDAKNDGVAQFAARAAVSGFAMSEQEAFVMDQVATTVQAALADGESRTSMGYRELHQLYREVYTKLAKDGADFHNGDWATATAAEKQEAKQMYDFIFKMNNGSDGKSDHLARFAAMGLANEKFNQILMMATDTTAVNTDTSFLSRLQSWLNTALEMFVGKVTHTFRGQQANTKLTALIDRLVYQQEKRNGQHKNSLDKAMDMVEEKAAKMSQSLRNTMEKVGKSSMLRNSKNGYLRAAGVTVSAVATHRVSMLMEAMARMYTTQVQEKNNFFSEAVRELINNPERAINILRRGNKHLENLRKDKIDSVGQIVMDSFQDGGSYLTEGMHRGVSAYLRVDMAQLLDDYSMDEIQNLLDSNSALDKEIETVKAKLSFLPQLVQNMMIGSANGLGYFNATGKNHNQMLYKNALQISRLAGSVHANKLSEADRAKAERIIDTLATLYGMQYVDADHRASAREVFRIEQQRGEESGMEMTLRTHKHLMEKSRSDLFSENENLTVKGYLPEIYDPHRQVTVADEVEGKNLEERGWTPGEEVAVDPADPDKTPRRVYYLEYGAKQGYNTGALGLKGRRAKGSRDASSNLDTMDAWVANELDQQTMTRRKRDLQDVQRPNFDPSKVRDIHAAPVFDNQGNIDKYNYLMNEKSKDTLLDRDNHFGHMLGAMAGSIFDKSTVEDQNRKVMEALLAQKDKDFAERSGEYVTIGKGSTSTRYREMYDLLSPDTKRTIREVWGEDNVQIRADLVYSVFGFRDPSISKLFSEDYKAQGRLDKMVIDLGNFALGKKAEIKLAHYEDIWQAFVNEAKDMIVIRTFSVLKNNVISNESVLLLAGLSVGDSIKHQITAFNGARAYKRDKARMNELRHRLRTGLIQGDRNELVREMRELEDALANNPVRPLIAAGLMPTIVEDVVTDEDRYSYRTKAKSWLSKKTEWVNPQVVKAAKFVYMDKDTKAYQALYYATQISDFMARYALYKHHTTRDKNPLSHEDAIEKAAKVFVEYDIPSHHYLEYLNKVGAVRFTKYYMRIQRVIFDLYHENPARALAMLVMGQSMEGLPLLSESSMIVNPHSPMSAGAFEYIRSFDDLATVKLGNALLK